MICSILFFCVVLVLMYKYFTKNHDYWKKRNMKYHSDTLWKFITGNRPLSAIIKDVYDEYPTDSNVGIFIGSKPALIIKNLDNIQSVLARNFINFNSRGIFSNPKDLLADNLLFMEDYRRWKLVRQKLSPVFTSMKLKNMFTIMEQSAKDFVDFVEENEKMRHIPFNSLYTYTTASIGASIFGIDARSKSTMNSPFLDMSWKTVTPTLLTNLKFFIANNFPTLFNLLNLKQFGEHEDFFIGVVKNVLKDRRQDANRRYDFIDICVSLQQSGIMKDPITDYELEPTDELLAAQFFFFFVAGADTSANTMHFTLLELSFNPKILENVHTEIDSIFEQRSNDVLLYDDIDKLIYLDMVINEAMRKHPPIGHLQRRCTKDTVLTEGQTIEIEKNVIAIIPVLALHMDKKYFPNPEIFDPERFSSDNLHRLPKYCYLPFGEGNRICIGARFARLQVKAGLAWLFRRFTLKQQSPSPCVYEASFFSIRAPAAHYELVSRASK